ncbi:MAG TPA: DUF2975 domain-containing protein [Allosphingosinicella sp.]|uniref:DUF2975 domain-containing protein n=1 Tax=Allosphingosinicella sp. TaxID=2823234 RepID=UPI002EDBA6EB
MSLPNLARSARRLRLATLFCTAMILLFGLLAAVVATTGGELAQVRTTGDPISAVATAALFSVALWRLIRMLRRIEGGETFTQGTVSDLRGFSLYTLLAVLASVLLPPMVRLASDLQKGGRTTLSFDIGGSDLIAILAAALLFFVARLLVEAQRLADENSQIV